MGWNEKGTGSAGIHLYEEWIEKFFGIHRVWGRIMLIKFAIDNKIITVLCYALRAGADEILNKV